MKAHQNRNMNYDEMHDYGMFNEAAHLARGNLLSLCYHKYNINCSDAHTSVILASRHFSQLILASHSLFPLLEGSQLAQHASSDEAHGAVDSASGLLCHQGSGSSRSCAASDGSWRCINPSVAVLTGADRPLTPPTAREGGGMK